MKKSILAVVVLFLITLVSSGQLNYERKQTFDFRNQVESFIPMDINKDNQNDLVFSYYDQDYITYRLNNGKEASYGVVFKDMRMIKLEKYSSKRKLYSCDINNDAFNDIIFSEYDNSRIGIAINNTQSQFNDIYYFNSGSKPTKILSADFNKDQLNDLALICEGSKQMQVYLGNTTSKLSEPLSYSILGIPSDMELTDVNNDGFIDIMVSDTDNNKLQLFTGNGDGTFLKGLALDTKTAPVNFQLADFDGDQLADVAVVFNNLSLIQVFYQLENHTFSSPVTSNMLAQVCALDFFVKDLNSDGYMDMAIRGKSSQKIEFLLGKSGNQFSPVQGHVFSNGSQGMPQGFYMQSISSTNKLTFLHANLGTEDVTENSYNADFSLDSHILYMVKCANVFYDMEIVDMNNDHIKDLLLVNQGTNTIWMYYGKSDQSYEFIKIIPSSINYISKTSVADINKDGYLDIVASGYAKSEIMINDGTNNFSHTVRTEYGQGVNAVLDVNNNGNPDVFLNSRLYLDIKDGSFERVVYLDEYDLIGVSPINFNNDGNQDMVCIDHNSKKLTIYPGNGDGTFLPEVVFSQQIYKFAVEDMDKDGFDDIVAYCLDEDNIVLFRNNKAGGFNKEYIPQPTMETYNLYVLDFDNDGKKDIIFPSTGSPTNSIRYFPVNSDGSIGEKKAYLNTWYGQHDMIVTDADGDGSNDLFMLSQGIVEKHSNKIKAQITLKNLVQTYDGLQVDDLVEKTTPAGLNTSMKFNNLVIRPKVAGTYKTVVTISDDLYKGTIDTVLVINKAPLTVKTADKAKDYGAVNPSFTIDYTGFVNGEAKDFIDLLPTVSCTADQNSNAGSYPIVVSGGSDNNYQLNYENGSLTINKRKLTAKAENSSRKYGEKNPLFAVSYTGFINNETIGVIDQLPTAGTTATLTSAAGTYDITAAAGEDNNYDFDYQKGTLTIEKAPLTVKVENKTRKYGQENPAFSFSFAGFANNETQEVIDQLPVASTTATKLSPAWSYEIGLNGGLDNNYQLELQKGNLSIEKAPLTIKAENQSRTYGEKNPPLTFSFKGFANNETMEVIDQLPVAATTATELSSAGSYDIVLSGGMDNNYVFELQNGTMNISKAKLTLQADDKYKRRGEENPALTLTAKGFVNNEGVEVIDVLPVVSTTADKSSPAGNYSIDLSGGYDNNYEFSFISGTMKIDFPLASENGLSSSIRIYPIPARETLYVENLEESVLLVQLIDLTGSVVKTMACNTQSRLAVSVSDLASGVYFLETVYKNQKAKRYKVIVD
ncbi:MAG TPA: MBG domain-containing protein [Prolixibacteraceae bacterium]|nr:MBG domain-containing protein [Prolixibacteraceae bacterium]